MPSMRILLINPPVPDDKVWVREGRCQQWDIWGAPFPPFSLAMISTQLKAEQCQTRIIDAGPEKKGLEQVLRESAAFSPQVVILATTSPTIQTDLAWFAPALKKTVPGIKIAAIGIHVSALPEDVLQKYPALDLAVIGEPEITCREVIRSWRERGDAAQVAGVALRTVSGRIQVNPMREFLADIDALGFPDWEKIDFKNYLLPIIKRPFSLISFSRGCPFRCKFCATHTYNGPKLRRRSVPSLLKEIEFNLSLGVRDFLFWTELMTLDHAYLHEFLDALMAAGLHRRIAWVCNSRVDSMTEDLVRKMKKAGCWQIAFGFEFGDVATLRAAQKGGTADLEAGRRAAQATAKAGIAVDGHFIMGYPGETPETLQKTIDFACSLPMTFAHFYACVPFPGSPLYDEAVQKGWFAAGAWQLLTQDSASLKTDRLNAVAVDSFIRRAYKAFYLRPVVFFRMLKIPKNFREFFELFRLGGRFLQEFKKK